ncbi:OTU-domain-containing protein [Myriangium duriaei CBS 260.36]|uniref:Ubiquitin thioesterase OTU n=1 Tax=Myriangium duriaei CBS 260.36 TaxID=1168546 RepID=A0A9P4MDF6_9PEZI|nr:OTU-domain-containing protein [Myriangium duriaei CBS 260.36]
MRIRLRGPSGASAITIPDDSTWGDLKQKIASETSIPIFDLKYGYPPQTLGSSSLDDDIPLLSLGLSLNNEQLTIIPVSDPAPLSLSRKPASPTSDLPLIPVPHLSSKLTLRVMPDDNSCLFRALSSALLSADLDGATELRSMVAQRIQADPTTFSPAVLDKPPDDYCEWIQRPDSWGGGIELSILSQEFDVEIVSLSVQDGRADVFNDGRPRRVVVVYSGIHYDVVALTESGELRDDRKVFDVQDGEDGGVLAAARELCGMLRDRHYYTDTKGFDLKCNVCGWKGKGEQGATEHATQTGHMDFGES